MDGLYYQYVKLKKVKLSNKNQVINMSEISQLCSSLTALNLSNFNNNNIEDISSMFFVINKGCNLNCNDKKILNEFS